MFEITSYKYYNSFSKSNCLVPLTIWTVLYKCQHEYHFPEPWEDLDHLNTSWTMGALIIHMLSRFNQTAASQRPCFPSGWSLCSVSPRPQDWKGLWRGHEQWARARCAYNHISERNSTVTDLLSNQGDFWSGFCGQNSQWPPLSRNPLSVEPLTLSIMSQSAL